MNNQIRKQLENISTKLSEAQNIISECKEELESIRDDEQDKFDNMTEGLQATERGQKMEEVVEYLDSAVDNADTVDSTIADILSDIDNCM